MEILRRNARLLFFGAVFWVMAGLTPVLASAVYDAVNADKVDGFHAVGPLAADKATKLVATNTRGVLPAAIVPKTATPWTRYLLVRSNRSALENGLELREALVGIDDATAARPWIVMLEPGEYAMDGISVALDPHIEIVGAGIGRTIISGSGGKHALDGLVRGADRAALRQVSLRVSSAFPSRRPHLVGVSFISNGGENEFTLDHVAIEASYDSPKSGVGSTYGVHTQGHKLIMDHVQISVFNGGVNNFGVLNTRHVVARDSHVLADGAGGYGIYTAGIATHDETFSSVTATESYFGGTGWGAYSRKSFGTFIRSELDGVSSTGIGLEANSDGIAEAFEFRDSIIRGESSPVVLYPGNSATVKFSEIHGGPLNNSDGATGTITCRFVLDESNNVFHDTCPS